MASRSGVRATETLGNSDVDDDTGDIGYDLEDLDSLREVRNRFFPDHSDISPRNRGLQDDV